MAFFSPLRYAQAAFRSVFLRKVAQGLIKSPMMLYSGLKVAYRRTVQHNENTVSVLKIGGNVLDSEMAIMTFLTDFMMIPGPKILVHGGGKIATRIGAQMGLESHYVNGRRITDDDTRDLVTMVYGGLVNKQIVAHLQQLGCNAIGLTGADANLLPAHKRPVEDLDFGWVGDLHEGEINTGLLSFLLAQGIVPVIAPLSHDGHGNMLNINADTIASALAVALSKAQEVRLMYCFEKQGILLDVSDETSVIHQIDRAAWAELLEAGVLADGILPKLENAFEAIDNGVQSVWIGHAEDVVAQADGEIRGTLIVP